MSELHSLSSSRRAWLHLAGAVAATVALWVSVPAIALADEAPDAFVSKISNDVLGKIKTDAALKSGSSGRVSELVDSTIMPVVDFERMTASAVGRSWRTATPDQRKRLMDEFRTLLIRTYSGALASVSQDTSLRMKPFRGQPQDKEVVVRSEVVGRGDPIQLDYRLEKSGDSWKIYDLNILGVWLVDTYRNQFNQEISANGIDGLIQSLADKNKAAASKS